MGARRCGHAGRSGARVRLLRGAVVRDALTTATEVVGMILIAVAVALALGAAWVGFALAGAALVAAGIAEGRR